MLLQQSIEPVSIVYTCVIYCVMRWSMLFIREYLVNVLIQHMFVKKEEITAGTRRDMNMHSPYVNRAGKFALLYMLPFYYSTLQATILLQHIIGTNLRTVYNLTISLLTTSAL